MTLAVRLAAIVLLAWSLGCRTVPKLPPVDLSQSGWTTRHGQALWQRKRGAPEIAGELIVAAKTSGDIVVEFTKTPFPVVIAQLTATNWQVEFPSANRRFSGNGAPSKQIGWLQLPRSFAGQMPAVPWKFKQPSAGEWSLDNTSTGERISGYFAP